MPYFSDLAPYSFLVAKEKVSPNLLNVGWLSSSHAFHKAAVDPQLLEIPLRLCRKPVRLTRGFHRCDLCSISQYPMISMTVDGNEIRLGNGEIRVSGANGIVYATPTLICHYINKHKYCPPEEFLDAVALLFPSSFPPKK